MRIIIITTATNDAFIVHKSSQPLAKGLVSKSPNVAQNGLVKIKAIQNNTT
jgi:hypothetical protein